MLGTQHTVSLNIASLHTQRKPCYSTFGLASLVMDKTTQEEAERLRDRFRGVNRAEFARNNGVPGGAAMIYQHITGRRPISLEAAHAYANGFGCTLDEISPRLADEARKALAISSAQAAPSDLLAAWDLLTQKQRQDFIAKIKEQAEENRATIEELAPPEVIHSTVNVRERRMSTRPHPFTERRKKNA